MYVKLPKIRKTWFRLSTITTILRKSVTLEVVCTILVLLTYWFQWESIEEFAMTIDEPPVLFEDFTSHYYPAGEGFFAGKGPVPGYLYSAFFALLLAILALFPVVEAVVVWGVLQVATMVWFYAVTAGRLLELGAGNRLLYLLVFLTSFPLIHNFKWGQVSVLITLGIALAFIYQHEGRSAIAGLALAMVTCIKYYPGVLLLYFIIQRDLRFLVAFGLGIVGFYVLLPSLWLGIDGWLHFTTESISGFPLAREFYSSPGSQYVVHVILRWAYNLGFVMTEEVYNGLRWANMVFFALHVVLAEWFRRQEIKSASVLAVATLLLALPLVVPSSWPHYFVYLPLCQMAVALSVSDRAIRLWARCLMWLPLAMSIVGSNIYTFIEFPNPMLYYNVGLLFFSNILSLIALYSLGIWILLRRL
jgi:hypothetical protein